MEYKKTIKLAKLSSRERAKKELESVRTLPDGWKYIRKFNKYQQSTSKPPRERTINHFRELL